MRQPILITALTILMCSCSSIDVSAGHLRSSIPRFTTFGTKSPELMTNCINQGWTDSGYTPLTVTHTDTGFTLQSSQKLSIDQDTLPMYFVEVNTSREGSSVRFYTNRADEIADRSMINLIQRCN